MTELEATQALSDLFSAVFQGRLAFCVEVVRRDNPVWDSLNHMRLMLEIEKRFSIPMTMKDVLTLQNGGALVEFLLEKHGRA